MKLHQRGGATYHLRIRVPTDLVDLVGRREMHQSLRTSDGRTARSRASQLKASIVNGFDRLRFARLRYEQFRSDNNVSNFDPQMRVSWLVDHEPQIPADAIAKGIGVAKSVVYRYLDYRSRQLAGEMHPFKVRSDRNSAAFYGFDMAA
jgi:hypothetical protein